MSCRLEFAGQADGPTMTAAAVFGIICVKIFMSVKTRALPPVLPAAVATIFLFFSCGTMPKGNSARNLVPFLLMDGGAEIYFLLPVEANKAVSLAAARKFFPSADEKDLERMISRIGAVYGGVRGARTELVFALSVPRSALKTAFTEKNGWMPVSPGIYRNSGAGIEAFCDIPGLLFVSDSVAPMVGRLKAGTADYAGTKDVPADVKLDWFGTPARTNTGGDIRFYIPRASALAEKLFAAKLPSDSALASASVEGRLSKTPAADYFLSLDIDLKDARAVAPAMLLLRMSGAFADARVSRGSGARILVADMPVRRDTIADLLF
jgi:hypothetical protein